MRSRNQSFITVQGNLDGYFLHSNAGDLFIVDAKNWTNCFGFWTIKKTGNVWRVLRVMQINPD